MTFAPAVLGLVAVCATPGPTPAASPAPSPGPASAGGPRWSEQVVVAATRSPTRIGDTPASVTVITADDLRSTAASALDDGLRQIPGFSLFRRTGSRFANPTAQGVSLRGVGASGASRAAVLYDGVPIADPFGGWIYWTRVPRLALDRVEVVRGAGSSLYGTDALGGVVSLVPRPTPNGAFAMEASFGSADSSALSATGGGRRGPFGASLSLDAARTAGQFVVDEDERGPVDSRAGVDFGAIELLVERRAGEASRAFLRGTYFEEARDNGTALQTNDTRTRQVAIGADFRPFGGAATLRAWSGSQTYRQDFSAVGAGRATETLSRAQRTPSSHFGVTSQASRAFGPRWAFVAGFDARVVDGETDEVVFAGSRASSRVVAGGRARFSGVFAEAAHAPSSRILIGFGARFDEWRHAQGSSVNTALATGLRTGGPFPDRTRRALSPRVSFLGRVGPRLSLTASASRGFRAPTLNELYRSFRVGNVVTQSNADLGPETSTGAELGAHLATRGGRARARVTAFASSLADPVTNLTIAATPELVTRRRENLGRTSARGVEIEATVVLSPGLTFGGSYAHTRAVVEDAPGTPLAGRTLPQTPRRHASAHARYAHPRGITLAVQARAAGSQFDDDLNALPLGSSLTVDALASAKIARGIEAFVAFENLFDGRMETGRAGITTIGPPRTARGGIRMRGDR